MIGIADLDAEVMQLVQRLFARGRRHPCQGADVGVISLEEVVHQLDRLGFRFRREIFCDVILAQCFAHCVVEQMRRARRAWELLGHALQRRAVEGKIFVVERLGQEGRVGVQVMRGQIVTPHCDGRLGKNLRQFRKRGFFGDDNLAFARRCGGRDSRSLEIGVPRELRRQRLELRKGHRIVDLVLVAAVFVRPIGLCHLGFKIEDALRALVGIAVAGQREHRGKMLLVGIPVGRECRVVLQIIIAVGHPETGLSQVDRVGIRILFIDTDTAAHRPVELQARVAHRGRNIVQRLEARDISEILLRRGEALRIDLLLIEERVIEIAQFLFVVGELIVGSGIERRRDFVHPRFAEDPQILERAGARAIRRNNGALVPGAVDEHEKVVARLDALIHSAEFDAPGTVLRVVCRRIGERGRCAESDARRAQKGGEHDGIASH